MTYNTLWISFFVVVVAVAIIQKLRAEKALEELQQMRKSLKESANEIATLKSSCDFDEVITTKSKEEYINYCLFTCENDDLE